MIEVKHLFKSFGDKEVLKDINVVFEDGKTNLIIGQSGAGKTMLMRSLTGLIEPTKGEVLYDGRNFVNMSKKEQILMRREMGMIFQGLCPLRLAHRTGKCTFSIGYVLRYDCART